MSESAIQRKPLAVKNGSRLPMPGSRLKPPTNFKRARSPDAEHEEIKQRKRSRTDSFEDVLPPPKQLHQIKSTSSLKTSTTLTKQPSRSKLTHFTAATQKPKPSFSAKPPPKPVVSNGIKIKPGVLGTANRKPLAGAVCKQKVNPVTETKPPAATGTTGKKRAAWDVKGRLLDTEQALKVCRAELGVLQQGTKQEIKDLAYSRSSLQEQRDCLDEEVSSLRQSLTDLTASHTQMMCQLETAKRSLSKSSQLVITREAEIAQLKETIRTVEEKIEETLKREKNLEIEIKKYDQKILELERTLSKSSQLVITRESEIAQLKEMIRTVEEKIEETLKREKNLEIEIKKYDQKCFELERSLASANELVAAREGEISQLKVNIKSMEKEMEESNKREETLDCEINKCNNSIKKLELNLNTASKTIVSKDEKISGLEETINMMQSQIADFESNEQLHEMERRKLHNMVQELKGNIRVFCRVRPLLQTESYGHSGVIPHMSFPDPNQQVLELDKCADTTLNESMLSSSRRGQSKYEFQFDKVFQPEASQAEVFDEISQLVQSALDGYNVCIFAYGQTGSGKTYTMEGPSVDDADSCGMISRAVEQIFQTARKLEDKGWKYQFQASMLEIYNESIRDLVEYNAEKKHEIKLVGKDHVDTEVTDLTVITVENEQQVHKLLKKASHNRAVAETKCNEHSSRSHSVFQLKLRGTNTITTETCSGILSLVDLAGSERLKESGSEGQRLKETLSINKSLSNLGNVIMALGNKDSHVPYRNSTLTYLLKNSLGGNSKTLMFVNVSPKEECFQETVSSLRFATKVNQCNIGTARKKTK